VAERLEPAAVESLQAHGLSARKIAALIIPTRTLLHRRSRAERLTVDESERVVRIARILALATTVFGSPDRGIEWLRAPLPRFDGAAPMALLATDVGTRMVEELLIQIDEGYLA
jgi:putative toxin-antitoxin system antitoxin component (TIGR02293 family)